MCVDALGGESGVLSARYAGEDKDDQANCEKVIQKIQNIPENKRSARFECVIAVAKAGKLIGTAKGVVEGVILTELLGENGFGYDPLFYYPLFKKTLAQVPSNEKHHISHRAKALNASFFLLSNCLFGNDL